MGHSTSAHVLVCACLALVAGSVDIVVARDAGDVVTIDVKGLAGTSNWPVDNLKEGRKRHFIVFVSFLGKISNPAVVPEVYIVPSEEISSLIYQNPSGSRRVVQLGRARREWGKFKDAWESLR